jgi:hypothetical protein
MPSCLSFGNVLTRSIDIDLTTLVPALDNAASDLVGHQRDSLVQRKDLAQKTKEFRKLDDATKVTEVKGILKGKRNNTFGDSTAKNSE